MQHPPSPPPPAASLPKTFWLSLAVLSVAFIAPLLSLAWFAFHSALYSYVLLIPAVSLYFAWQRSDDVLASDRQTRNLGWWPLAAGIGLLLWYGSARLSGGRWATQDYLALTILAWLLLAWALCIWFLDTARLRALAFPLGFLVFMVPLPTIAEAQLETFLQHGSALAARFFFMLSGTTVFVDGLVFQLPNITLQIAPECSGIHSSLALFITGILAGYIFLRSPGRRTILALAVIPLALARNGLRVFVIGELCVRIGPEMIHSYIHRNGGPLFFVLSLIPFFILLVILMKSEKKPTTAPRH
jgi:exosortase C (VPDSG-CTERM-specific)